MENEYGDGCWVEERREEGKIGKEGKACESQALHFSSLFPVLHRPTQTTSAEAARLTHPHQPHR